MARVLGIVTGSSKNTWVEGLENYRGVGAFSFLGRYRTLDFPMSNLSNSGVDCIQVYIRRKPRSIVQHIGTGRHYSINSKRGKVEILFSENQSERDIYNTDITSYMDNLENIEKANCEYVVIVPSYMVYTADYSELLDKHIASGAEVTLLYHNVENAKDTFHKCDLVNLNRQQGVLSLERNKGNEAACNISLDTYIMSKELFIELIKKAHNISSLYTLSDIINAECGELDVRGVEHTGYVAAITDFKSYYEANLNLIDYNASRTLFKPEWPIYTRTNDSCPTHYCESADVKNSVISNGCVIEGTVENSIIGRGCTIKKGTVVKNCVILPDVYIAENAVLENVVVDKHASIIHTKEIVADAEHPGYVKRSDTL